MTDLVTSYGVSDIQKLCHLVKQNKGFLTLRDRAYFLFTRATVKVTSARNRTIL